MALELVGCLGCIHKFDEGYVTDGVVTLCYLDVGVDDVDCVLKC